MKAVLNETKQIKRFLALLLSVAMIFAYVPTNVAAYADGVSDDNAKLEQTEEPSTEAAPAEEEIVTNDSQNGVESAEEDNTGEKTPLDYTDDAQFVFLNATDGGADKYGKYTHVKVLDGETRDGATGFYGWNAADATVGYNATWPQYGLPDAATTTTTAKKWDSKQDYVFTLAAEEGYVFNTAAKTAEERTELAKRLVKIWWVKDGSSASGCAYSNAVADSTASYGSQYTVEISDDYKYATVTVNAGYIENMRNAYVAAKNSTAWTAPAIVVAPYPTLNQRDGDGHIKQAEDDTATAGIDESEILWGWGVQPDVYTVDIDTAYDSRVSVNVKDREATFDSDMKVWITEPLEFTYKPITGVEVYYTGSENVVKNRLTEGTDYTFEYDGTAKRHKLTIKKAGVKKGYQNGVLTPSADGTRLNGGLTVLFLSNAYALKQVDAAGQEESDTNKTVAFYRDGYVAGKDIAITGIDKAVCQYENDDNYNKILSQGVYVKFESEATGRDLHSIDVTYGDTKHVETYESGNSGSGIDLTEDSDYDDANEVAPEPSTPGKTVWIPRNEIAYYIAGTKDDTIYVHANVRETLTWSIDKEKYVVDYKSASQTKDLYDSVADTDNNHNNVPDDMEDPSGTGVLHPYTGEALTLPIHAVTGHIINKVLYKNSKTKSTGDDCIDNKDGTYTIPAGVLTESTELIISSTAESSTLKNVTVYVSDGIKGMTDNELGKANDTGVNVDSFTIVDTKYGTNMLGSATGNVFKGTTVEALATEKSKNPNFSFFVKPTGKNDFIINKVSWRLADGEDKTFKAITPSTTTNGLYSIPNPEANIEILVEVNKLVEVEAPSNDKAIVTINGKSIKGGESTYVQYNRPLDFTVSTTDEAAIKVTEMGYRSDGTLDDRFNVIAGAYVTGADLPTFINGKTGATTTTSSLGVVNDQKVFALIIKAKDFTPKVKTDGKTWGVKVDFADGSQVWDCSDQAVTLTGAGVGYGVMYWRLDNGTGGYSNLPENTFKTGAITVQAFHNLNAQMSGDTITGPAWSATGAGYSSAEFIGTPAYLYLDDEFNTCDSELLANRVPVTPTSGVYKIARSNVTGDIKLFAQTEETRVNGTDYEVFFTAESAPAGNFTWDYGYNVSKTGVAKHTSVDSALRINQNTYATITPSIYTAGGKTEIVPQGNIDGVKTTYKVASSNYIDVEKKDGDETSISARIDAISRTGSVEGDSKSSVSKNEIVSFDVKEKSTDPNKDENLLKITGEQTINVTPHFLVTLTPQVKEYIDHIQDTYTAKVINGATGLNTGSTIKTVTDLIKNAPADAADTIAWASDKGKVHLQPTSKPTPPATTAIPSNSTDPVATKIWADGAEDEAFKLNVKITDTDGVVYPSNGLELWPVDYKNYIIVPELTINGGILNGGRYFGEAATSGENSMGVTDLNKATIKFKVYEGNTEVNKEAHSKTDATEYADINTEEKLEAALDEPVSTTQTVKWAREVNSSVEWSLSPVSTFGGLAVTDKGNGEFGLEAKAKGSGTLVAKAVIGKINVTCNVDFNVCNVTEQMKVNLLLDDAAQINKDKTVVNQKLVDDYFKLNKEKNMTIWASENDLNGKFVGEKNDTTGIKEDGYQFKLANGSALTLPTEGDLDPTIYKDEHKTRTLVGWLVKPNGAGIITGNVVAPDTVATGRGNASVIDPPMYNLSEGGFTFFAPGETIVVLDKNQKDETYNIAATVYPVWADRYALKAENAYVDKGTTQEITVWNEDLSDLVDVVAPVDNAKFSTGTYNEDATTPATETGLAASVITSGATNVRFMAEKALNGVTEITDATHVEIMSNETYPGFGQWANEGTITWEFYDAKDDLGQDNHVKYSHIKANVLSYDEQTRLARKTVLEPIVDGAIKGMKNGSAYVYAKFTDKAGNVYWIDRPILVTVKDAQDVRADISNVATQTAIKDGIEVGQTVQVTTGGISITDGTKILENNSPATGKYTWNVTSTDGAELEFSEDAEALGTNAGSLLPRITGKKPGTAKVTLTYTAANGKSVTSGEISIKVLPAEYTVAFTDKDGNPVDHIESKATLATDPSAGIFYVTVKDKEGAPVAGGNGLIFKSKKQVVVPDEAFATNVTGTYRKISIATLDDVNPLNDITTSIGESTVTAIYESAEGKKYETETNLKTYYEIKFGGANSALVADGIATAAPFDNETRNALKDKTKVSIVNDAGTTLSDDNSEYVLKVFKEDLNYNNKQGYTKSFDNINMKYVGKNSDKISFIGWTTKGVAVASDAVVDSVKIDEASSGTTDYKGNVKATAIFGYRGAESVAVDNRKVVLDAAGNKVSGSAEYRQDAANLKAIIGPKDNSDLVYIKTDADGFLGYTNGEFKRDADGGIGTATVVKEFSTAKKLTGGTDFAKLTMGERDTTQDYEIGLVTLAKDKAGKATLTVFTAGSDKTATVDVIVTGLYTVDEAIHYMTATGEDLKDSSVTVGDDTYYFDKDGKQIVNGVAKTSDGKNVIVVEGKAKTGLQTNINGHNYYAKEDYSLYTGKFTIGEDSYYADPTEFYLVSDEFIEVQSGVLNYFGDDGKLVKGNGKDFTTITSKKASVRQGVFGYLIDAQGVITTNKLVDYGTTGKKVFVNSYGQRVTAAMATDGKYTDPVTLSIYKIDAEGFAEADHTEHKWTYKSMDWSGYKFETASGNAIAVFTCTVGGEEGTAPAEVKPEKKDVKGTETELGYTVWKFTATADKDPSGAAASKATETVYKQFRGGAWMDATEADWKAAGGESGESKTPGETESEPAKSEVASYQSYNIFFSSQRTIAVPGLQDAISAGGTFVGGKKGYYSVVEGEDAVTITSTDKKDIKAAANAANSLITAGAFTYQLPVYYQKPTLKLSSTKGIRKKNDSAVYTFKTSVLEKKSSGNFEPIALEDGDITANSKLAGVLALTEGSSAITTDETTVSIATIKKGSGKLVVQAKDGDKFAWAEPVELSYSVTENAKDVIDLSAKTVNMNVQATKIDGATLDTQTVTVKVNGQNIEDLPEGTTVTADLSKITGKGVNIEGIDADGKVSASELKFGYDSTITKGTYKIKLTAGTGKAEISVKVADKDINKAVTLTVKSKMDVTKHQKMVIIPKLNTVGGEIAEEVGISEKYDAQYYAESNKIVIGPKDDDWKSVSKGSFEEDITVTVAGIPCKYKVKTKILAAKPTVNIAAVTFAKSAFPGTAESPLTGETNILATYKMNGKTFSMEPDKDGDNALVKFPNGTASNDVAGGYLDSKTNTIVKYDAETGKIIVLTTAQSKKGTVKVEITYPGQTAPMKKSFKIVTK